MASYQRPSAPLSIGGVLDDGLRLYRVSIGPLFPLSLLFSALATLPTFVMMASIEPGTVPDPADMLADMVPLMIVTSVLSSFGYAAMIARLDTIARHASAGWGETLATGMRRGLPVLVSGLLGGLAMLVGIVLLVLPGIYLMVALVLFAFPAVLDRRGPVAALRDSYRLVKGSWWRTASLLTVGGLMAMLPYMAISFLAGLVTAPFITPENAMRVSSINLVLTFGCYALVWPMMLCVFYSTYSDLRLRRQGGDLEQRLETVAA